MDTAPKTKTKNRIITDLNKLYIPTKKVESIEEGEKIAAELFSVLNDSGTGIGLTANQIGIDKSVFVINVKEPLYFINPRIITSSINKVPYVETCLSIPKYTALTLRNQWVEITADNLEEPVTFGNKDKVYKNEDIKTPEYFDDKDLLEAVTFQHEFHHTKGTTIKDIDIKPKQAKKQIKPGRNEKIMVAKDGKSKFIKYKKLEIHEKDGWVLT